jgi:hypothetical protein
MAIPATNSGTPRELIPAGNYIARCYSMIHIGTVTETIQGQPKTLNKVRIGWELPTELKTFKEEQGPQPLSISKEYTLSLNEKANLRKMLASWRGKDFTEEEAKMFDVTRLIGATCMLNIIHKPSEKNGRTYEEIGSVSPMPKGVDCPVAVNRPQVLEYDKWDQSIFDGLPDFIKDKKLTTPNHTEVSEASILDEEHNPLADVKTDDLPF